MKPMEPSKVWTDKEVQELMGDEDYYLNLIKPVNGNEDFAIEGSDGYLFKCVCQMYDHGKMMEKLGIRKDDGWEDDGCCSDPCYTPKDKCPDPETVEAWFQFVNHHGSDNIDDWEYREIPTILMDDSLVTPEEYWCIIRLGRPLADMRKGENYTYIRTINPNTLSCLEITATAITGKGFTANMFRHITNSRRPFFRTSRGLWRTHFFYQTDIP